MGAQDILKNNFEAREGSFLFYLQRKQLFHKDAFKQLYDAIRQAADENIEVSVAAQQINFIYGQVLKCFMYHFDKNDQFKITNVPEDYNRILKYLEDSVAYYFSTRI